MDRSTRTEIHIGVGLDESYQEHTCVMVKSLFDHTDSSKIHIHAITDQDADLNILKELCEKNKAKFSRYHVKPSDFQNVSAMTHLSIPTYYRILLPQKISKNVNTLLYLDSDMVILENIRQIYKERIKVIAKACYEKKDITILEKNIVSYFNAGVMLINCSKWRDNNLSQRALHLTRKHSEDFPYADQDLLNYLLDGNKAELSSKWNVKKTDYRTEKSILNDAKIIHYTGSLKPWHRLCLHPRRNIYRRYAKILGFKPVNSNPFVGLHSSLFPEYPKYVLRIILEKIGLYTYIKT